MDINNKYPSPNHRRNNCPEYCLASQKEKWYLGRVPSRVLRHRHHVFRGSRARRIRWQDKGHKKSSAGWGRSRPECGKLG